MLALSSHPESVKSQVNIITPCNSCDIWKHYLVAKKKKKNCDKCNDKYIGSAVDFKPRFMVHKSDVKTKKEPLDILMKSAYVSLLLLDMSKFKSLNRFTWNT